MSFAALANRPCTIVRRTDSGEIDEYGDPIADESYVETTCDLQQRSRGEPTAEGEFSVTEWRLYLPIGTALSTGDAVLIASKEYEVVGDPWQADAGGPEVQHVEATLKMTGEVVGS